MNTIANDASQVVLVVKNLPASAEMQETWVQSLGQEDLLKEEMANHFHFLEEEMATHSSILA